MANRFRIGTQNLREGAYGRLDPGQAPEGAYDRLGRIADRLAPFAIDLLAVQEVRDQRPYNTGQARRGERAEVLEADRERMSDLGERLGMALAGITPSRSGIPSALLYRPGRLKCLEWFDQWSAWFTNGSGTGLFAAAGAAAPFAVTVLHADPWSAIDTTREVQRAASLLCAGPAPGYLAGDLNCLPAYRPEADRAAMGPHHRAGRLTGAAGPAPAPNLAPAQALLDACDATGAGFVDAAAAVGACEPLPGETAAARIERTRTGSHARIDQIHAHPALAQTPVGYWRAEADPACADHFGVVVEIDLDLAGPQPTNH